MKQMGGMAMARWAWAICGVLLLGLGCPTGEDDDGGDGVPAALSVEPESIDFGGLEPGQQETWEVTLTNTGGQPAQFSGTSLIGEGSFSVDDSGLGSALAPGASAVVSVSFAPPGYEVAEATLGWITDVPFAPGVELSGVGLAPAIEISPPAFDFDVCEVGCDEEQEIQIRSVGTEPLQLHELVFEMTSDDFAVSYYFESPATILPGQHEVVTLYYRPRDEVPESAYMTVTSNDPLRPEATGTYTGQAVFAPAITDTFQQPAESQADVLWVVDNSGNMDGYGAILATHAPSFLDLLDQAEVDFHLAVVTSDTAQFQGADPVMDPTTADLEASFLAALDVGTSGADVEQPLLMAADALTGPLAGPGGPNDGFLRDAAELRVVIYANEDDQSPQAGMYYALQLMATQLLDSQLQISGIINHNEPQPELETVIAATGGLLLDIHEDWWTQLPDLVDTMDTLPRTFELSASPIPETLQITVDGAPVLTGWQYLENPGVVVFDVPPTAGAEVAITYHPWCGCGW